MGLLGNYEFELCINLQEVYFFIFFIKNRNIQFFKSKLPQGTITTSVPAVIL